MHLLRRESVDEGSSMIRILSKLNSNKNTAARHRKYLTAARGYVILSLISA